MESGADFLKLINGGGTGAVILYLLYRDVLKSKANGNGNRSELAVLHQRVNDQSEEIETIRLRLHDLANHVAVIRAMYDTLKLKGKM